VETTEAQYQLIELGSAQLNRPYMIFKLMLNGALDGLDPLPD
jgi:hypothetical protein